MFELYFAISVILVFVAYGVIMHRLDDEVVDSSSDFSPKKVVQYKDEPVGSLWFVPRVQKAPEPETDSRSNLKEQYRQWIENARNVNESYKREYELRMQGSA